MIPKKTLNSVTSSLVNLFSLDNIELNLNNSLII